MSLMLWRLLVLLVVIIAPRGAVRAGDAPIPRDANLARSLSAAGVLGEWSNDCSKARDSFTFDRDGNAISFRYTEGLYLLWATPIRILAITNLDQGRFRITTTHIEGAPNDPSQIFDVTYKLEGGTLFVLNSRRRSGEVLIENGIRRFDYKPVAPRRRCADAQTAQANALVAKPYSQKPPDNRPDVPGLPPFKFTEVGVQCYALTILPTDSIRVDVVIPRVQRPRLQYDHWVEFALETGENTGMKFCGDHGVSIASLQRSKMTVSVRTNEGNIEYYVGAEKQPGQGWIIGFNHVKEKMARENQEASILAKRKSIVTNFGITQWVSRTTLISNPFSMKSRVVGFYGVFLRMMSESDALFGSPRCPNVGCAGAVLVSGVGPSLFTVPNEQVLLAVKVNGIRPNGGGPDLEYVNSVGCQTDGCSDYGSFSDEGHLQ